MCGGFGFINMFYTDNRTTEGPTCGNITQDPYYQEWYEDMSQCFAEPDGPDSCSLSVDGSQYSVVDGGISILESGNCDVIEPGKMVLKCSFMGLFNKFEQVAHAYIQILEVFAA